MFWESCIWNIPRGFSWVSNSTPWQWWEVGALMEYWKGLLFGCASWSSSVKFHSLKLYLFKHYQGFGLGFIQFKKPKVSKTFYVSNRTIISGIFPMMWALKYSKLCLTPDRIASPYGSWYIIPPNDKFVNSLHLVFDTASDYCTVHEWFL